METANNFLGTRLVACNGKPSYGGGLYSFTLSGQIEGLVLKTTMNLFRQKFNNAGLELSQRRIFASHKGRASTADLTEQTDFQRSTNPQTVIHVHVDTKDFATAFAIAKRISEENGVELVKQDALLRKVRGPYISRHAAVHAHNNG